MSKIIKKVAVIGAGFTGKQIAAIAALFDFNVYLFDINSDTLAEAKKYISGFLKRKKKIEALKNVFYYSDMSEAVLDADLVIEAVPENLELKRKVFSQIDSLAPAKTIIATNSSSYPVSRIESAVKRRDKVLNIHFYPPIPTRPMADIMRGTNTSDETFETGKNWIISIGCEPLIVKKECFGFVFNRIWHAVKKECIKMWAEGYVDIEVIDTAWKIFTKMPLGPFTMMDGIGLDTAYAVEMSYYKESGDPKDKPPQAFTDIVKRGDLGLKTGKGFYTWKKKK